MNARTLIVGPKPYTSIEYRNRPGVRPAFRRKLLVSDKLDKDVANSLLIQFAKSFDPGGTRTTEAALVSVDRFLDSVPCYCTVKRTVSGNRCTECHRIVARNDNPRGAQ